MDAVDWQILTELQRDARLSMNELSRRILLSAPAVAERVRRLQESGIISGFTALVDPIAVGRAVQAFVQLDCYGPRCILRDPEVATWPEVLEVHRVTGAACSMLRVAVPDMAAFEELIDRLASYGKPTSAMVLASPLPRKPVMPIR